MPKHSKSLIAMTVATLGLGGCLDSAETTSKNAGAELTISGSQVLQGTHPLFNPVQTEFPLPVDALFFIDDVGDGTMLNGSDPENPVTTGLGFLDGTSVLAPFDVKISASLDANQELDIRDFIEVEDEVVPNPNQNVFLIPLEYAGNDSLMQADGELAGLRPANEYRRALRLQERGEDVAAEAIFQALLEEQARVDLIDIDGGSNNALRIQPVKPLEPKTKYAVVLTNDIRDAQGNRLVGAPIYQSVANPERILSNQALAPFRKTMLPAREQAVDYFSFKRDVLGADADLPGFADVVYSETFTTTAIDDVLVANAAPAAFFDRKLRIQLRQDAVEAVVDGFYNVSDQPLDESASQEEQDINDGIFDRLTNENFRLFDPELADIITDARDAGLLLTFNDVARTSGGEVIRQLAVAVQLAAAEAAEAVLGGAVPAEAASLASAADDFLDIPKPRGVSFFSQRDGREVNEALGQNAADLGLGGLLDGATEVDIRVYEGEITLPYYLGVPDDEMNGVAIQGSHWSAAEFGPDLNLPMALSERITYRFPFARKNADTKVPIVVAAPDANAAVFTPPLGGFPVIIYQHAVTADRSSILPMATAAGLLCGADGSLDCFVTIGIDQPLHGIFPGPDGEDEGLVGLNAISEQDGASEGATERHFGFAADQNMMAVAADTLEEPESGSLFLNFTNYANTLDNMRQSTMDQLNIIASLDAIQDALNNCDECANSPMINTDRVYYLTHSLSGMGGVPVPRVNNEALAAGNTDLKEIQAQAFLNTGGHLTRLLENSSDLAPQLLPGLKDASDGVLAQGRTELNLYFNIFQAMLDDVDPAAYAGFYADRDTLLTSIIGDPEDPNPLSDCTSDDVERVTADCTVPNAADADRFAMGPLELITDEGFMINSQPAPLAGTEPLAASMGAVATPDAIGQPPVITRFVEGSHGNPISAGQNEEDPGSSEDVFTEMAEQLLQLFTSGTVTVNNDDVVESTD